MDGALIRMKRFARLRLLHSEVEFLSTSVMRASGTKPGMVFLIGNVLALSYIVPASSLALFFAASALLIYCRQWIGEQERGVYQGFAIGVLLLLLFYYHAGPSVAGEASPLGWLLQRVSPALVEKLRAPNLLSSVGISYCFLRSVYALLEPKFDLWSFTRYYFFFPTFFSGPVMRPDEYLGQTSAFHRSNVAPGLARMSLGAIKVMLSLVLQGLIPLTSPSGMIDVIQAHSVLSAWFFAFMAGAWLWLNFSGFSDICIGFAKLCNIAVPENFNNPFAARDITDFWRRWHMSLATWLRTCIYTPLSRRLGRRLGQQHLLLFFLPPVATMVVCGLWHGISSCYLLWGMLHGLGLVAHQLWKSTIATNFPIAFRQSPVYAAVAWVATHAYVALSWVFFFPSPTPSLLHSLLYLTRMFGVAQYKIDTAITSFVATIPF
jgi:D-alanyl-lipoteichoic acid acyltransferase DltB (MBOAT superfamily)